MDRDALAPRACRRTARPETASARSGTCAARRSAAGRRRSPARAARAAPRARARPAPAAATDRSCRRSPRRSTAARSWPRASAACAGAARRAPAPARAPPRARSWSSACAPCSRSSERTISCTNSGTPPLARRTASASASDGRWLARGAASARRPRLASSATERNRARVAQHAPQRLFDARCPAAARRRAAWRRCTAAASRRSGARNAEQIQRAGVGPVQVVEDQQRRRAPAPASRSSARRCSISQKRAPSRSIRGCGSRCSPPAISVAHARCQLGCSRARPRSAAAIGHSGGVPRSCGQRPHSTCTPDARANAGELVGAARLADAGLAGDARTAQPRPARGVVARSCRSSAITLRAADQRRRRTGRCGRGRRGAAGGAAELALLHLGA